MILLSSLGFYINAVKWEEGDLKLYELSNRQLVNLYNQYIDLPSDVPSDPSSHALMNRFFDSICKYMAGKFCSFIEGGPV